MSIAERLSLAMRIKGVSQATLGDAVGASQTTIWKLMTGKTLSSRKLLEISDYLNISVDWLANNKGEMNKCVSLHNNGAALQSGLPKIEEIEWDYSTTPDDEVEVPYFESIELAVGHVATNNHDYDGVKLRFDKTFFRRKNIQKENVICFPAKGNSMEPVIPNGAVVTVNTICKAISDGDVYAICQDELCRLKRLYLIPNRQVRIVSYNSEEHPYEIANLDDVEIIGRVFHYSVEL